MKKILVVDNDAGMRNLLAMAFRQHGLETFLTDSIQEAEAFLAEGSCGAILMDYHLGAGASGAQVLSRWQAAGDLPPFWLVTGTPEEAEKDGVQEIPGFKGTVAKPFSILDLIAAVQAEAFPQDVEDVDAEAGR